VPPASLEEDGVDIRDGNGLNIGTVSDLHSIFECPDESEMSPPLVVLYEFVAAVSFKPWQLYFIEGALLSFPEQSHKEIYGETFDDGRHALPTSGTFSR
jgi:hypothetical protein